MKPISGKWYAPIVNFFGKFIDTEWFVLMRPEYRSFVKLSAGRQLSMDEEGAVSLSLILSRGSDHLTDFRLLWLSLLDASWAYGPRRSARLRIAKDYRVRYGNNPIYQALWKLRDAKAV